MDEPARFVDRVARRRGGRRLGGGLRRLLIIYLIEGNRIESIGRVGAPIEDGAGGGAVLPMGEGASVLRDKDVVEVNAGACVSAGPIDREAVGGLCGGKRCDVARGRIFVR